MKIVELHLDEKIYERAVRLAQARRKSLEALLSELIGTLDTEGQQGPFLGRLADEPERADSVADDALRTRKAQATSPGRGPRTDRVVKKSVGFEEAERWDVDQSLAMTPEERMDAAAELRSRAYGPDQPDVRESHRSS